MLQLGPSTMSHVGCAFSGSIGGGALRTIWDVVIGAYDAPTDSLSQTVNSDATTGDVFYVVTTPAAASVPSALQVRNGENAAGGTPLAAANYAYGDTSFALPGGIANQSAVNHVVIDSGGTLSAVFTSDPFTIDTTSAGLGTISFSDNGSGGISFSFNPNEASAAGTGFRVTAWASGTNPDDSQRRTGTGAIVGVTGTSDGVGADTGTLACGAGVRQCAIYFIDPLGNETFYTHTPEITVAAVDPLGTDAGRIYHFAYDDVSVDGSNNVTNVNDKVGGIVDLSSIGAFAAPQKTGTGPLVFATGTPRVIQTPTADAAYRDIGQYLRGGGSNAVRMFLVVDAATLPTSSAIFFSENSTNSANGAIRFGASITSDNIVVRQGATSVGGSDAMSANSVTTTINAAETGKCIIELHITQTTWEAFVDGVSVGSGSITAANFPNPGTAFVNLGGIANAAAVIAPAGGDFYEFFATQTADSTFAATVRSYLNTRHGM